MSFIADVWAWIKLHPQRTLGMTQAGLGAVMTGLPTLDLPPRAMAVSMFFCGVIQAVLGWRALNGASSTDAPAKP